MKFRRIKLAAAQMKFRCTVSENTAWIIETIHSMVRRSVDVILFPECAVSGYNIDFTTLDWTQIEAALEAIARAACMARCHVLVGCPTLVGLKRFNSLIVFDRRGHETFRYSKIHLTGQDARIFTPGDKLAFFRMDGIPATAIICHERRYPELVRVPVMMGARIVFHPNAGLDPLAISEGKREGRDGMPVRAFENQVFYVFSNSVGPQGNDRWSAGDSKIVAPDGKILTLANNEDETVITAPIDLIEAKRQYAVEALRHPAFLRRHWRAIITACARQARAGTPGDKPKPKTAP